MYLIYVPGRFKCAADALSRLKPKMLAARLGGEKAELPDDLLMAGDPAPDGDDSVSLVYSDCQNSLQISISKITCNYKSNLLMSFLRILVNINFN